MCMSRSFTYLCQNTKQWWPLCLKKSLTSHRMQLQWINFAVASDSMCLLVPWWPKIDLTGRLMAPAALTQQSSVYNRNPRGATSICLTVYLNQKVNVVIFKQQRRQTAHMSSAWNTRRNKFILVAMQLNPCFWFTVHLPQWWNFSWHVIASLRLKGSLRTHSHFVWGHIPMLQMLK